MELSKFLAFRPDRDEAIRQIDAYLDGRRGIKKDVESWLKSHPEGSSETPRERPGDSLPTGPGRLDPWECVCDYWPVAAQKTASVLREAGETVEAAGIFEQLETLPTRVDWDHLESQHDTTQKAALRVKEILKAIRADNAGGKPAAADLSAEARALACLVNHPGWTDTAIAKEAGCARTSLYRFPRFVAARELQMQQRPTKARGSKGKDGIVEAWQESEGDTFCDT